MKTREQAYGRGLYKTYRMDVREGVEKKTLRRTQLLFTNQRVRDRIVGAGGRRKHYPAARGVRQG
jgi:hypothetical protein